jgi:hypothetical protein
MEVTDRLEALSVWEEMTPTLIAWRWFGMLHMKFNYSLP